MNKFDDGNQAAKQTVSQSTMATPPRTYSRPIKKCTGPISQSKSE